ncbi:MAG: peptide ABC transporter substrate-binding protein [Verrucomicrobiota bacterium]|nr:peptide ABC transporter substrate-binding protein [Verrucomicrobiota bacterium]
MTFLTKHFYLSGICILGQLIFSSCSAPSNVERAIEEQVLHFGLGAEPQYLDPHLATSVAAHNILSALLEGLVSEDPKTLQPLPGVAESWQISSDKKRYLFQLRKDALWHNGDSVTAHDFVYSYKRILNPDLGAKYASMLHVLKNAKIYHSGEKVWEEADVGVTAINDYSLELILENQTPYFLELLNHYAWFPVHPPTIEKFDAFARIGTKWTKPENFIGNGPFKLSEHKINSVIEASVAETYWDRNKTRLSAIKFYPIETADTEERAFRTGYLHVTQTVSSDRIEFLKQNHPEWIHFEPYLGTYYYRFNLEKPPFDDVRVRKALSLSVNRDLLVEKVLKGGQLPAYCFTPPNTGGFTAKEGYGYDPKKAKQLLDSYLKEKGMDELPPFELSYNTSEGHKKVAEALQAMWKKALGIEIQLLNMEWKVFLSTISNGDYSIARAGWIGDYVDANTFLHLWRTGDGNNLTGWSNADYDLSLQLAEQSLEPLERFTHFQKCEDLLADEVPILPLYFYVQVSLRHPTVKGWYPTLLNHHPYKYIHLEAEAEQ